MAAWGPATYLKDLRNPGNRRHISTCSFLYQYWKLELPLESNSSVTTKGHAPKQRSFQINSMLVAFEQGDIRCR